MPITFDWREVAHTYNGYEAAGSFEECAQISRYVQHRHRAGTPLSEFTVEELRSTLFFSARAERHGGDYRSENPFPGAIVEELVRRMGAEWIEEELRKRRAQWERR